MSNLNRKQFGLALLAIAPLFGGCDQPQEATDNNVETQQSDLLIHRNRLWERNPQALSVCWQNANTSDPVENHGRQVAQNAVNATWGKYTGMAFTGWGLCTSTPTDIRLQPFDGDSNTGSDYNIGNALYNISPAVNLNVTFATYGDLCSCSAVGVAHENNYKATHPGWTDAQVNADCRANFTADACIQGDAAHEFGHVLGFSHEEQRSDTPSWASKQTVYPGDEYYSGAWDVNSIMSYSNPRHNNFGQLSPTDIIGSRLMYGWGTDQPIGRPFSHVRSNFAHSNDAVAKELVLYRPSEGNWYWTQPNQPQGWYSGWGIRGDAPFIGDFDADGQWDLGVFRPSTHQWYIRKQNGTVLVNARAWGQMGDIPVVADYDGDGVSDLAVFRPVGALWYAQKTNGTTIFDGQQWGVATLGDVPVVGDYDGDGKADLAVWRQPPSGSGNGTWYIRTWAGTSLLYGFAMGQAGDIPVSGDFDGDHKSDLALFTPSTGHWSIFNAQGHEINSAFTWGQAGDVPVSGDFDNDGKSDLTVYRPSDATWWSLRIDGVGITQPTHWGLPF
jgi:hypothetical protein